LFWKKQDVDEIHWHYLEKWGMETKHTFWATFCILFHFDTLSGCKDTNVEALLSKCATYIIFLTNCNILYCLLFKHIRKIAKSDLDSSCLSVRLHGTTLLPIGWIFMKFDIWVFLKNLPRKLKFH
jgi:hypothetical protein